MVVPIWELLIHVNHQFWRRTLEQWLTFYTDEHTYKEPFLVVFWATLAPCDKATGVSGEKLQIDTTILVFWRIIQTELKPVVPEPWELPIQQLAVYCN